MDKRKRRLVWLAIFILILAVLIGDYYIRASQRQSIVMEVIVWRAATQGADRYHFILRDNKMLMSSLGPPQRILLDFNHLPFSRTLLGNACELIETQLTEDEYNHLIEIANRLPRKGHNQDLISIANWGFIEVFYNGALYSSYFLHLAAIDLDDTAVIMNELVNEIVGLSPLLERLP